MLVGPTGSGKSVVALHAAADHGGRLRWCRLAPGYADSIDLVALAGGAPSTDDVVVLAGALLDVLEAEPTVVVVDDYHHATPACDLLLAEVITLLAPECRVVVAGRTRPAGLLGRLPAGLARVAVATDLAFTGAEATALLGAGGERWCDATAGWAAALGMVADATAAGNEPASPTALVDDLVVARLDEGARALLGALDALPYLTPELASSLGVGDGAALAALAELTGLVVESEGFWRLQDVGRQSAAAMPDTARRQLQLAAADLLADSDAAASIELLLDAGEPGRAADLLVRQATDVGEARAVRWAYRMPAEVRRRLPPHLTASRATVDLDAATADARLRAESAETDDERADALLALGTAQLASGDLASAAEVLESIASVGTGRRRAQASAWLGAARWWLGDLVGADAALASAGSGVLASWVRAHVALALGHDVDAAEAARRAIDAAVDDDLTVAAGESVLAILAVLGGDTAAATSAATRAFAAGRAAGGFDLVCGAVAAAWTGVDVDGAMAALDAKIVRQDAHARLHLALLQLATASDTESRERAERRLRDLRGAGFAPVESLARRVIRFGPDASAGLRIELLGELQVVVDGHRRTAPWRSRKALETLLFLAAVGPRGASREAVIEAVWPEREPEKGRTLLRTALSEIRRVLEPGRPAGEPSRFLVTAGERVSVDATTDVADARAAAGDAAFELLAPGLADLDIASEWIDDLRRDVERRRLELAERVAGAGGRHAVRALEVLIDAEPWQREHVDALAALHRAAGDEAAARAVERRWFEDDS